MTQFPLEKKEEQQKKPVAIYSREWFEENKSSIAERQVANILASPFTVITSSLITPIILWILSFFSDAVKTFIFANPLSVVLFVILLPTFFWLLNVRRNNKRLLTENVELKEEESKLTVAVKTLEHKHKELLTKLGTPQALIETRINSVTGLINFYERLENSDYHPRDCLPNIKHHLDFMGNGASKWTIRIAEEILENAIRRIAENNGKARFLILNPLDLSSVLNTENKKKIAKSLRRFREIQREMKNNQTLEVKVFNHIPQFRLTFIDNERLIIGHYGGKDRGDSKNSPLLEFSRDCNWSFYHAFFEYFERQWHFHAEEPNWTEIEKLY